MAKLKALYLCAVEFHPLKVYDFGISEIPEDEFFGKRERSLSPSSDEYYADTKCAFLQILVEFLLHFDVKNFLVLEMTLAVLRYNCELECCQKCNASFDTESCSRQIEYALECAAY